MTTAASTIPALTAIDTADLAPALAATTLPANTVAIAIDWRVAVLTVSAARTSGWSGPRRSAAESPSRLPGRGASGRACLIERTPARTGLCVGSCVACSRRNLIRRPDFPARRRESYAGRCCVSRSRQVPRRTSGPDRYTPNRRQRISSKGGAVGLRRSLACLARDVKAALRIVFSVYRFREGLKRSAMLGVRLLAGVPGRLVGWFVVDRAGGPMPRSHASLTSPTGPERWNRAPLRRELSAARIGPCADDRHRSGGLR